MPERLLHAKRRRDVLEKLRRGPSPRSVLVVCHGNICRSPYAAALLRQALEQASAGSIRVESAGFAGSGRPCPPVAIEVASGRGLDLSQHLSQPLNQDNVGIADWVLVMDGGQRGALRRLYRRARNVVILGDLDPDPIDTRQIEDPVEAGREIFERSYSRIERCVGKLVELLISGNGAPDRRREVTT